MSTAAVITIAIALAFDYTNGFHDAANSVATVVSTRVLSPRLAVWWAAIFNFVAFLVFETTVSKAIAKDVVVQDSLTVGVLFAGLIGAIGWNLITFWEGLPTSSSHALIGGMAGSAIAVNGFDALKSEGFRRIGVFIVLAPLIGMALSMLLTLVIQRLANLTRRRDQVNRVFRSGQLVSAAAYSLGHGGNDAQKTMGIIAAVLVAEGQLAGDFHEVPLWVVLSAHTAIGLGTLTGGWRIVKTMGSRITRLQPAGGFAAETGAAITLFYTSHMGIPVSTTHTITGAIVGVGTTRRMSAVRWGVASQVVIAWVITIPGAALIAAIVSLIVSGLA